jgi:hypothetical protein
MDVPETRYAKSGNVHVAYCIRGDGPVDLVFIPGWVSNIELMWEDRWMRAWLDVNLYQHALAASRAAGSPRAGSPRAHAGISMHTRGRGR